MDVNEKDISVDGLTFVILGIMLGWILDLLSSFIGIRLGLSEASQYFVLFPAGWLLLTVSLAVFVYKFKSAPFWLRVSIMLWLIVFSYVPAFRNSALILGMIFG